MKLQLARNRRSKGSALVETAFSCVLLFALLLGIMVLSMTVYAYHSLSDAAREGSRWASVRGAASCATTKHLADCNASASDIKTYVAGMGFFGIHTASAVTVDWCNAPTGGTVDTTCGRTNQAGNLVKVTVKYTTPFGLPFYSKSNITMSSTAQSLISQ